MGGPRVDALQDARGWRERAGVLASIVFPSPDFMRGFDGLARRGRMGLIAAYVLRIPRLVGRSIKNLLLYARTARSNVPAPPD